MKICLFEPEIPQNVGTIIRTGTCLNVAIDIIEPMGFVWHDKHLKRAGMDYLDLANVTFYKNFDIYYEKYKDNIILLDAKAQTSYTDFSYSKSCILLLGKESSGVNDEIFNKINNKVKIDMHNNARSLNIAIATAMVLGEAIRQNTVSM